MNNYAFRKLNKWQERQLPMSEFVQYREWLRQYEFETGSKIKGVRRKKIYHYFLLPIIILGRSLNRQKLTIISDKKMHTNSTVIYERYNDKAVTSPKEAFAFLKHLKPCWENAFLIGKHFAFEK